MLDLVQPIGGPKAVVRFSLARRDEPGWPGMLQHAELTRFRGGKAETPETCEMGRVGKRDAKTPAILKI
jgi:hypothetical protein